MNASLINPSPLNLWKNRLFLNTSFSKVSPPARQPTSKVSRDPSLREPANAEKIANIKADPKTFDANYRTQLKKHHKLAEPSIVLLERVLGPLIDVYKWYHAQEVKGLENITLNSLVVSDHSLETWNIAVAVKTIWEHLKHQGLDKAEALPITMVGEKFPEFIKSYVLEPVGANTGARINLTLAAGRTAPVVVAPEGVPGAVRPGGQVNWEHRRGFLLKALQEGQQILPMVTAGPEKAFYMLDNPLTRKVAEKYGLPLPISWTLTGHFPAGILPPPLMSYAEPYTTQIGKLIDPRAKLNIKNDKDAYTLAYNYETVSKQLVSIYKSLSSSKEKSIFTTFQNLLLDKNTNANNVEEKINQFKKSVSIPLNNLDKIQTLFLEDPDKLKAYQAVEWLNTQLQKEMHALFKQASKEQTKRATSLGMQTRQFFKEALMLACLYGLARTKDTLVGAASARLPAPLKSALNLASLKVYTPLIPYFIIPAFLRRVSQMFQTT